MMNSVKNYYERGKHFEIKYNNYINNNNYY